MAEEPPLQLISTRLYQQLLDKATKANTITSPSSMEHLPDSPALAAGKEAAFAIHESLKTQPTPETASKQLRVVKRNLAKYQRYMDPKQAPTKKRRYSKKSQSQLQSQSQPQQQQQLHQTQPHLKPQQQTPRRSLSPPVLLPQYQPEIPMSPKKQLAKLIRRPTKGSTRPLSKPQMIDINTILDHIQTSRNISYDARTLELVIDGHQIKGSSIVDSVRELVRTRRSPQAHHETMQRPGEHNDVKIAIIYIFLYFILFLFIYLLLSQIFFVKDFVARLVFQIVCFFRFRTTSTC